MVIFREGKAWQGHLGTFWSADHVEYLDVGGGHTGKVTVSKFIQLHTCDLLIFQHVLYTSIKYL